MLKDVPGYEGLYAITPSGRVWTRAKPRAKAGWRKTHVSWAGYERVQLSKDGKRKYMAVHRLVALTYIPNPDNLPQVNHIDGDKTNNSASNLEWCTQSHNQRHSLRLGLRIMPSGTKHWQGKKTHCKHGHAFTGSRDANGYRFCNQCNKLRQIRYNERKLEGVEL